MEPKSHPNENPGRAGDIPDHFFRDLHLEFLIHELKDPLAVVEAGVRALLERPDKFGSLSPQQDRTLRRVLRGALKGRTLLYSLLEIGRSEAEQFAATPFAVDQALWDSLLDALETMDSEAFAQVSAQQSDSHRYTALAQLGIVVHLPPEMEGLVITQDATTFRQIVGNLLKNALRFRNQHLDVTLCRDGEWLLVDIRDDGPGIKVEDQKLIFQQYAQAAAMGGLARQGHGLGLAGALILARRLGGDITVHSEAGNGALFRLTVPMNMAIHTPHGG